HLVVGASICRCIASILASRSASPICGHVDIFNRDDQFHSARDDFEMHTKSVIGYRQHLLRRRIETVRAICLHRYAVKCILVTFAMSTPAVDIEFCTYIVDESATCIALC